MKRVSFETAKYLKEVGYPQGLTEYKYVTKDYSTFKEGEIIYAFYEDWAGDNVIDAPFAMEVWLWLCREKKIFIEVCHTNKQGWFTELMKDSNNDPEEAIEAAIRHLVEHNLLK